MSSLAQREEDRPRVSGTGSWAQSHLQGAHWSLPPPGTVSSAVLRPMTEGPYLQTPPPGEAAVVPL